MAFDSRYFDTGFLTAFADFFIDMTSLERTITLIEDIPSIVIEEESKSIELKEGQA